MRQLGSRQRGAIMLLVIAILMLAALTALVTMTGELISTAGRRISATEASLEKVTKALVSFVATHQRLPCPANPVAGAANPGWPDGVSPLALPASTSCIYPAGVVPWAALGLSAEDAVDEWGRLISYRVYDGTYGLTQDTGASAANCDTDNVNTPNVEPLATGLCSTADDRHDTLGSHFINYTSFGATPSFSKGLKVFDFGPDQNTANVNNVAFVLISHGASGLGGYTQFGVQVPGTTTSARDYANTQANPGFFIRQGVSSPDVLPGTTGFFDDVVSYMTLADLLTKAQVGARDWAELDEAPTITAATTANMTTASVDPLAPRFMSTTGTAANQAFTPTDGGTTIQSPTAAGSFASCLWWPGKLTLVSTTTRRSLNLYMQFAATDNSGDPLSGFVQGFLAGTSSFFRTASGSAGTNSITVSSGTGISVGMTALGTGIATNATVSAISGDTVTLTANNTGSVQGNVVFGAPTNATCGTSVAVSKSAVGTKNDAYITVSNTTGISTNMYVYGYSIPFDVVVDSISGSNVFLRYRTGGSARVLRDFSGQIDFANGTQIRRDMGWAGGTLTNYVDRFGAEFDAQTDGATNDPGRPHLAIDYTGVTHGTDAGSCATAESARECDAQFGSFLPVTRDATGSSGLSTITIMDSAGVYGIVHGMGVSGTGISGGTTVTGISSTTVTLSKPLIGSLASAPVTFGALSTSTIMQNGLGVFHGNRVEVSPRDCYTVNATGSSGASSVTLTTAELLQTGMSSFGPGIGAGATISGPIRVNLSAANSTTFTNAALTFTGGGNTILLTGSGDAGQTYISLNTVAGVSAGMVVSGGGVESGATVSNVTVTLNKENWQAVSNSVVFAGATGISTFATGSSGSTSISLASASNVAPGMSVLGTGLASGVTVSGISGTTVTLSSANTGTVNGVVKFYPKRTLIKSWALTNSGCNAELALCNAMANTTSRFVYPGNAGASTTITGSGGAASITVGDVSGIVRGMAVTGTGIDPNARVTVVDAPTKTITLSRTNTGTVSGVGRFNNRQMLHAVSCLPAASVVDAYDALHYGFTTSSRTTAPAVSRTAFGNNGSTQLTLSTTAGIIVGMEVRAENIGDSATVVSIDSGTQITLSVPHTGPIPNVTVDFAGGANMAYRNLTTKVLSAP